MTDTATIPAPGQFLSTASQERSEAFRRAGRHSSHVRWLRRIVLFGAAALVFGVFGFAYFDPFGRVLPANVSIDGAGVSGTRVTMQHPKMSGFRQDGRPYDVVAENAVQDVKTPNLLELNTVEAHVTLPDKSQAHVTSDTGLYDSSKELMDLKGNVHFTSQSGYDVRMSVAHVEFKGGNVTTTEPVTVIMNTGTVHSDAMQMTDNGKKATFTGHVHSIMNPGPKPASAATGEIKGSQP